MMLRRNVIDLLNNDLNGLVDEYGAVNLEGAFYTPSFIVPLVCYLKRYPISQINFGVHPDNKTYFKTIGLYKQLWENHDTWQRANCGRTYSPIICLNSMEHVDQATEDICSCLRLMVEGLTSKGLAQLEAVVGELHDNVWSHGKATGFSMAQTYQGFIEFTLADQGFGLLGEMRRAGKIVNNHEDAIK